mgnify:CR=1 FL=1
MTAELSFEELPDGSKIITIQGINQFQGHFNSKTALFLKNLKFAVSISPNGYIEFNRSNIKVTLT